MTEPAKPSKGSIPTTTDARLVLHAGKSDPISVRHVRGAEWGRIFQRAALVIEREWLAAAAERDAIQAARQSGDAAALAAAKLRRKEATNHCNEIMARYQRAAGVAPPTPPPPKPPKPVPPPDTRKPDAAREIEAELADLIGRADAAGLTIVAGTMIAARDVARRLIERTGTEGKAG